MKASSYLAYRRIIHVRNTCVFCKLPMVSNGLKKTFERTAHSQCVKKYKKWSEKQ